MSACFDLYVLARERSTATAERFLTEFAPDREVSADDYCFPQNANEPDLVLTSPTDAIRYCEAHPEESQSFYFRNRGAGAAHAMLFFTSDAGLILGLSAEEGEEQKFFDMLRQHADSEVGYIDFEAPPADTVAE